MRQSAPFMGTIVTIEIVDAAVTTASEDPDGAIARAFEWFRIVETTCTRFDLSSELMRLCERAGVPTPVSEILFASTEMALAVAEASHGAFDPTAGSFREITIDAAAKTVGLPRPLAIDLNAVAKGLAIDLAARELRAF